MCSSFLVFSRDPAVYDDATISYISLTEQLKSRFGNIAQAYPRQSCHHGLSINNVRQFGCTS